MTYNQWHESIGLLVRGSLLSLMLIPQYSDGQKRPVFIYRFLTAGTIDGEYTQCSMAGVSYGQCTEKIYQRQVTKIGLSNCQWHHPSHRVFTDFACPSSAHGKCKTIILDFWHTKHSLRKLPGPKRIPLPGEM